MLKINMHKTAKVCIDKNEARKISGYYFAMTNRLIINTLTKGHFEDLQKHYFSVQR